MPPASSKFLFFLLMAGYGIKLAPSQGLLRGATTGDPPHATDHTNDCTTSSTPPPPPPPKATSNIDERAPTMTAQGAPPPPPPTSNRWNDLLEEMGRGGGFDWADDDDDDDRGVYAKASSPNAVFDSLALPTNWADDDDDDAASAYNMLKSAQPKVPAPLKQTRYPSDMACHDLDVVLDGSEAGVLALRQSVEDRGERTRRGKFVWFRNGPHWYHPTIDDEQATYAPQVYKFDSILEETEEDLRAIEPRQTIRARTPDPDGELMGSIYDLLNCEVSSDDDDSEDGHDATTIFSASPQRPATPLTSASSPERPATPLSPTMTDFCGMGDDTSPLPITTYDGMGDDTPPLPITDPNGMGDDTLPPPITDPNGMGDDTPPPLTLPPPLLRPTSFRPAVTTTSLAPEADDLDAQAPPHPHSPSLRPLEHHFLAAEFDAEHEDLTEEAPKDLAEEAPHSPSYRPPVLSRAAESDAEQQALDSTAEPTEPPAEAYKDLAEDALTALSPPPSALSTPPLPPPVDAENLLPLHHTPPPPSSPLRTFLSGLWPAGLRSLFSRLGAFFRSPVEMMRRLAHLVFFRG